MIKSLIKSPRALSRRMVLRGLGGVAIALPTLEIMLNRHGDALAAGDPLPRRFLVAFNGQSLGGDNDPLHNSYVPDIVGPDYDLKIATMPLGNYGAVKDDVSIVSGLRVPYNTGMGIPAGGWDVQFHTSALGPLLTGVRNKGPDDFPGGNGPTADQIVAEAIGQSTNFKSLTYQVQAAWYLSGGSAPYGRDILSYKLDGMGNPIPNPGQVSPKAAFDSLFMGFVPPDPGDAKKAAYELAKRKSIIDLVRGDFEKLIPQLGKADNLRMQRHLDEIRDLEIKLKAVPPEQTPQCMMLADPGVDPPVGGDNSSLGGDDMFNVNNGYSDEVTRARVFHDLIHMAFVCDLSRSVALLYTMAQSHMNIHPIAGHPYDQHELGHAGLGTLEVSKVIAWHVDLFASLVAKVRDTPEGAGSLLDSCAMVLLHEGGHGYDPAGKDNSSHSTENMACLIAGRAGGLRGGQHIVATDMHPGNVLNTAMRAVGVDQDLGEVVGVVPGLLA